MYRGQRVRVIKGAFTPRDRQLSGRESYRLKFEVSIREDSILLVSGTEIFPPEKQKFLAKVEQAINSEDHIRRIQEVVKQLSEDTKRKSNVRKHVTSGSKPIIPGSSLKGVSRSRLEYMFRPKSIGGILISYSCFIVSSYHSGIPKRHLKFWGEMNTAERETCDVRRDSSVCIVCDIYGSASLASRVDFSDAVFDANSLADFSGGFGHVQAIRPKSKGEFFVIAKNFNNIDASLLLASLGQYKKGSVTPIGFYKYRYNPIVGTNSPYGKKYFGLVSFDLVSVEKFNIDSWVTVDKEKYLTESKNELDGSEYSKFIDLGVGWI
jgi:hypothetical protein